MGMARSLRFMGHMHHTAIRSKLLNRESRLGQAGRGARRPGVVFGLSATPRTAHPESLGGMELFFDGDTGTTVPGPPSLRTGIEITNNYNPAPWVRIVADLALSRARFVGFDSAQEQLFESLAGFPQAQILNAPGNFVPEAPWMVASPSYPRFAIARRSSSLASIVNLRTPRRPFP
jgi:hypothetical protein